MSCENAYNWSNQQFLTSCNNFVYQKTLIHNIFPRIIIKVNVSATMGMSATVGEMSTTVGELNML